MRYILILVFIISIQESIAENFTSKAAAVQLSAEYGTTENPYISLTWEAKAQDSIFEIRRKNIESTFFPDDAIVSFFAEDMNSWTDTNIVVGQVYEYEVISLGRYECKNAWDPSDDDVHDIPIASFGYIAAGIKIPPALNRGRVLIVVDETLYSSLENDIEDLQIAMNEDNWLSTVMTASRHDTSNYSLASYVRKDIKNKIQEFPDINTILLLGHVSVPYSGVIMPDGHGDHKGAWPADTYYTIHDYFFWSDDTKNFVSQSRPELTNIPKDGKLDQDYLLKDVKYAIGRVDLWDMRSFQKDELELLKKYIKRNIQYRRNELNVQKKALIDDNFDAVEWPESYASTAWRNFPLLVGKDNIVEADWIETLSEESYLFAYGCGPGDYASCHGIGLTTDNSQDSKGFAQRGTDVIFCGLLGSKFGDWNTWNNFLRAPMAADPGCLTITWDGIPHWYYHHMTLGYPIGFSAMKSQNNDGDYLSSLLFFKELHNYPLNGQSGNRSPHITLLGDPTLRIYSEEIEEVSNAVIGIGYEEDSIYVSARWEVQEDENEYLYAVYQKIPETNQYKAIEESLTNNNEVFFRLKKDDNKDYIIKSFKLIKGNTGSYYEPSRGIKVTKFISVDSDEEPEKLVKLYPNPARNEINIEFETLLEQVEISLHDINGKEIFYYGLYNSGTLINIKLDDKISAGTYIVVIKSGDKIYRKKIQVL